MLSMFSRTAATLGAVLIFTNASFSQSVPPFTGLLYHTTENTSLVHRCEKIDQVTIECNFTQTSVRRKLSSQDGTKKLQEAKDEYVKKPQPASAEECAGYAKLLDVIQGRIPAPDQEKAAKMSLRQKSDFIKLLTPMVSFCQSPTLDNFIKFVSVGIEKDKRTCLVSSNHYTQRLQKSDQNTWTVIPQRQGPCGIVQLDRFEADTISAGTSRDMTFWNYIARKAVTNPKANAGLISCNKLDEAEYKYEWRKRELDINCDYIEFSPK